MKKVFFVSFLFFLLNNCLAQPGYNCEEGNRETEAISSQIKLFPDSLLLYERRFDILIECGSFEEQIKEIDFLLSKKPKSAKYLLDKAYRYLRNSYIEVEDVIPYFEDYFKEEKSTYAISHYLVEIGRKFAYYEKYDSALVYYDKALATDNLNGCSYADDNDILKRKSEVYQTLSQYDKALKSIEAVDGELSIKAIRYNTVKNKDYATSKQVILKYLKQNCRFDTLAKELVLIHKAGIEFTHIMRHIYELAYTEYQLGNEEKAIEILHNFSIYNFKNLGNGLGEMYQPYWCMYMDLYKNYKQDYRVHLITAYNYANEAFALASLYRQDKKTCKPYVFDTLECKSFRDFALEMNNESEKEIKIAENLASKEFNLFRAVSLIGMKQYNEAIKIVNESIKQDPSNYDAYVIKRQYYREKYGYGYDEAEENERIIENLEDQQPPFILLKLD